MGPLIPFHTALWEGSEVTLWGWLAQSTYRSFELSSPLAYQESSKSYLHSDRRNAFLLTGVLLHSTCITYIFIVVAEKNQQKPLLII